MLSYRKIVFLLLMVVYIKSHASIVMKGPLLTMLKPMMFGSDNRLLLSDKKKHYILDGNGFSLLFSGGLCPDIEIPSGVELLIQNICLSNFSPSSIRVKAGGSLVFGNKCIVSFAASPLVDKANFFPTKIILTGNVIFDLCNNLWTVNNDLAVVIKSKACLTLKNGQLNLACSLENILEPSASLTLKDIKLCLQNQDICVNQGSIYCQGRVKIYSKRLATLSFNSPEYFVVKSKAKLCLGPNIILQCNPCTAFLEPLDKARKHFVLEDAQSVLKLNEMTLKSSEYGFSFDRGKIVICGNVFFDYIKASGISELPIWDLTDCRFAKASSLVSSVSLRH